MYFSRRLQRLYTWRRLLGIKKNQVNNECFANMKKPQVQYSVTVIWKDEPIWLVWKFVWVPCVYFRWLNLPLGDHNILRLESADKLHFSCSKRWRSALLQRSRQGRRRRRSQRRPCTCTLSLGPSWKSSTMSPSMKIVVQSSTGGSSSTRQETMSRPYQKAPSTLSLGLSRCQWRHCTSTAEREKQGGVKNLWRFRNPHKEVASQSQHQAR